MVEFIDDLDEVGVIACAGYVSGAEFLDALRIFLVRSIHTLLKTLGKVILELRDKIFATAAEIELFSRSLEIIDGVRSFTVGTPATNRSRNIFEA